MYGFKLSLKKYKVNQSDSHASGRRVIPESIVQDSPSSALKQFNGGGGAFTLKVASDPVLLSQTTSVRYKPLAFF